MSQDPIATRIAKLLTQANHPNTGAAEARSFAEAAQRLMLKHSIDESMLHKAGGDASKVIRRDLCVDGQYAVTRVDLLVHCARTVGVKILRSGHMHVLVGTVAMLDTVDTLFASLSVQMARDVRLAQPPASVRGAALVSWRKQYLFGWSAQVGVRLAEQAKLARHDAEVEHGPGVGLVLVTEQAKIKAAVAEMFPNLGRARKRTTRGSFGGRDSGRSDGARADIGNRRIGGTAKAIGR